MYHSVVDVSQVHNLFCRALEIVKWLFTAYSSTVTKACGAVSQSETTLFCIAKVAESVNLYSILPVDYVPGEQLLLNQSANR